MIVYVNESQLPASIREQFQEFHKHYEALVKLVDDTNYTAGLELNFGKRAVREHFENSLNHAVEKRLYVTECAVVAAKRVAKEYSEAAEKANEMALGLEKVRENIDLAEREERKE